MPRLPISVEGASRIGRPEAQAVMIIFSDFECPFCGRLAREVLPQIIQRHVETGAVQVAFFHLPLTKLHPTAFRAAEVAACAGVQGRFWPLHDEFFRHQKELQPDQLETYTVGSGIDRPALQRCLDGGVGREKVNRDLSLASTLGVTGTPTLFFGTKEGGETVRVKSALAGTKSIEEVNELIGQLTQPKR